jgi:hypothetical protein
LSKIGVYTVDITPPLGIGFIGYHRPTGVRDIHDRIYATAFVFEKGEERSVMVSVDNIGLLVEDTTIIREQISKSLEISEDKIMVLYTHTHSGPETEGTDQLLQSYKTTLMTNIVQAAVLANKRRVPAKVGWNVTLGDIGVNRREITPEGKAVMGTNPDGVVDRRIGVLAMKHEVTDRFLGLVVFCTAHPNVLKGDSDLLSADYPGLTKTILQQTLGCPVIVVQGAAGNVNAKYRGSLEALEKMAFALSGSVLTALPGIEYQPIQRLRTVSSNIPMRLKDVPDSDGIRQMAALAEHQWGVNTDEWRNALFKMLEQNTLQLSVDLEVQLFGINEGSFTGIPMEPFSESALKIKDVLEDELAFFGGYTNGYLGYLPTKGDYPYGGYEVELNPVVYGPVTGLWMPPVEETNEEVVKKVIELYQT